MIIRGRTPSDTRAIEALVDRCFPPEHRRRTAALLRGGSTPIASLSFVAEDADRIVGSVACHPIRWEGPGGAWPLVLLGPLVTVPERRGEGIGSLLMAHAVSALDGCGDDCLLVGDLPYYGRFGFREAPAASWELPGPVEPGRLLLRSGQPERWAGPARVGAAAPFAMPRAHAA